MSAHRCADYLEHMADAAKTAHDYVAGMSKSEFLQDRRTQQAVIFNLIVIGEAASKLIAEYAVFLDRYPHIQWHSMKGIRNRMAHAYFSINLDVVWETVQTALPELMAQLIDVQKDALQTP